MQFDSFPRPKFVVQLYITQLKPAVQQQVYPKICMAPLSFYFFLGADGVLNLKKMISPSFTI